MPRFVTIGYGDRDGYDQTDDQVLKAAHASDEALKTRGAILGIAGEPVRVRNPNAERVIVEDGPFLSAELPLAGFGIIEAADIQEAIEIVSKSPCAVAQGIVEVWPLQEG